MYRLIVSMVLIATLATAAGVAAAEVSSEQQSRIDKLEEPLYNPFVERYVLDELRALRTELQQQRADISAQLASARLESADRAINYTTSTVNNIFYIIAAAASIFALVGWSSLRDIRHKLNDVVEQKVANISSEYEKRLISLERKLKDRTEKIIAAQEEIAQTNTIHSLWMRAGLEATPQSKIKVYDQILELNPEDAEALTYKADAVLEIGEAEWALNLCNNALGLNPDYAYAHYQRACAHATLEQFDSALTDLRQAINLSSTYYEEALSDSSLDSLRSSGRFSELLQTVADEHETQSGEG